MKKPDFLHVNINSWKLKVDWKKLWWAWLKGHSGHRTLTLAVSQEVNNEINWFLECL